VCSRLFEDDPIPKQRHARNCLRNIAGAMNYLSGRTETEYVNAACPVCRDCEFVNSETAVLQNDFDCLHNPFCLF
jgi:hypothetical protein